MSNKAEIQIGHFKYQVEVIGGVRYVDGKTIDEFMKQLSVSDMEDLAEVGLQAIKDEKSGTKPRTYKQMMKCFHLQRNN